MVNINSAKGKTCAKSTRQGGSSGSEMRKEVMHMDDRTFVLELIQTLIMFLNYLEKRLKK